MILSGHQPCYLPGIQLFNKIALSDAFMFTGHCDYQPKSWHSHNFIRTCELTVPIKRPHNVPISEAQINGDYWKRKHVKSIEMAYRGFRFFDVYFPALRDSIMADWLSLGRLNTAMTVILARWLGIQTPFFDSRSYPIEGAKEDMLISVCKAVGADEYLSNEGSRLVQHRAGVNPGEGGELLATTGYIGYPQEAKMKEAGITHRWQKFQHPVYGQESTMNGGRLSVIDLLFRHGPRARAIIEDCGSIV